MKREREWPKADEESELACNTEAKHATIEGCKERGGRRDRDMVKNPKATVQNFDFLDSYRNVYRRNVSICIGL